MNNTSIEEWNKEFIASLTPNIVLFSIYILLGLCGNAFVVLVYRTRMKNLSTERYFIPILAIFDLIASVQSSVFGIIKSVNYVTFTSDTLCRILQFFAGFTTYLSVLVLLIIAVQRYNLVCKSQKIQMTLTYRRRLLILTTIIAFFVAFPLPFVYGIVKIHNAKHGITGLHCGKLRDGNSLARIAYGVVIGTFALTIVTSLCVLYSRIGYTVYNHFRIKKRKSNNTKAENLKEKSRWSSDNDDENAIPVIEKETQVIEISKSDSHDSADNTSDGNAINVLFAAKETPSVKPGDYVETTPCSEEPNIDKTHFHSFQNKSMRTRRRKRDGQKSNKLTIMFIVITCAFVISYIPKIGLMIYVGSKPDYWEHLSGATLSGAVFVDFCFVLNNIINPFIYAFMDVKFSNESKQYFKNLFRYPQ